MISIDYCLDESDGFWKPKSEVKESRELDKKISDYLKIGDDESYNEALEYYLSYIKNNQI